MRCVLLPQGVADAVGAPGYRAPPITTTCCRRADRLTAWEAGLFGHRPTFSVYTRRNVAALSTESPMAEPAPPFAPVEALSRSLACPQPGVAGDGFNAFLSKEQPWLDQLGVEKDPRATSTASRPKRPPSMACCPPVTSPSAGSRYRVGINEGRQVLRAWWTATWLAAVDPAT